MSKPYFSEDAACRLFVENLEFCRRIKKFRLFAYKLNPDHVHLLIEPGPDHDFSDIMGSLKRNFARDYNDLIKGKKPLRSESHDFGDWHKLWDFPKGRDSYKGDDSHRRLCAD